MFCTLVNNSLLFYNMSGNLVGRVQPVRNKPHSVSMYLVTRFVRFVQIVKLVSYSIVVLLHL